MIVVLSLLRPRLENALHTRGQRILALIPEGAVGERDTSPGYPVRTIAHWDDYNELLLLATEFEAMGVTAVATIDEPCIRAAAFLRETLDLPGQNLASAVACTDKSVMKRRLSAAGIPVAEHRVVASVAEIGDFLADVGGDIVVKPRHGFGTINTHRVTAGNFEQLVAAGAFEGSRDLPDYLCSTNISAAVGRVSVIAEKRIDIAAEYHCELLLHEGTEVHCLPGRYSSPMLGGSSMGSVLLDENSVEGAAVRELTRAAAAALGVTHGFGHCEIFRDSAGRWLVGEFASRPGGLLIPRMLELNLGIDNLALLCDQLAGRQPAAQPGMRSDTVVAWRAISVVGSGVITAIPSRAQLLSLPGVIDAEIVARPGTPTTDLHGAAVHAAYILVADEASDAAEKAAERAERLCRIVVEPAA